MRNLHLKTPKFMLFILLTTIMTHTAYAIEVYKSKAPGGGLDLYKQYGMCRSNDNNGFIFAGTTLDPNGDNCIHIIETDNSFVTSWSYYYHELPGHTFNCTKIINRPGGGYWVSGYAGDGPNDDDQLYPFIMRIDNNGNIIENAVSSQKGAFLDIQPTDGCCIAVGFLNDSMNERQTLNRRKALIVKFKYDLSGNLTVDWCNIYHAAGNYIIQFETDFVWYDVAENVTVINNGGGDSYFIMGTVSDSTVYPRNKTPTTQPGTIPNLFFCHVLNDGSLDNKYTTLVDGSSFDAVYDKNSEKLFFVGKMDYYDDYYGVIGKIDIPSGVLDYQFRFEGNPAGGFPYAHTLFPYKIEESGDELFVFGYERKYQYCNLGSCFVNNTMIPFHARFEKDDLTPIDLIVNHSDSFHTRNYPSQEPGFLYSCLPTSVTFDPFLPTIYAPEMGLLYLDGEEALQWGMFGYFDQSFPTNQYDLHFINSESGGECSPWEDEIEMQSWDNPSIDTDYLPLEISFVVIDYFQKDIMDFDDNDC